MGLKRRLDLIGQRFNKLVVVEFAGLDKRRNSRWLCRCDCGGERTYTACNLKSGRIKGCGCVWRGKRVDDPSTDHPELTVFTGMLDRCYNQNSTNYPRYGGRGITVCDRWRDGGFKAFFADMGPRPTPTHSIDRIDNNKGYSPDNCRWATKKQQSRNTRTNRYLTHNGVTATLSEWAEILGISPKTLRGRLYKGISVNDALKPKSLANTVTGDKAKSVVKDRNDGVGISELSRRYKIDRNTVKRILKRAKPD